MQAVAAALLFDVIAEYNNKNNKQSLFGMTSLFIVIMYCTRVSTCKVRIYNANNRKKKKKNFVSKLQCKISLRIHYSAFFGSFSALMK